VIRLGWNFFCAIPFFVNSLLIYWVYMDQIANPSLVGQLFPKKQQYVRLLLKRA
jgi:hypothetical protein